MDNKDNAKPEGEMPAVTKESVEQELTTEARFTDYFENFQPWSKKSFIDSYAFHKALWWQYGQTYISLNEQEDMRWINAAAEHLEVIQQKKLFDAQCLWRAEKADFPEVEICFDFVLWSKDVLHCPFIEPISQEDIDLYTQYLQGDNVDLELVWMDEWQDYEELKEACTDLENSILPEWYDFYNGRKETGVYMSLPDIRGEREQFYRELYCKKVSEEMKEINEELERKQDKRPGINFYDNEQLEYFIKTFDNKQTWEYYSAFKRHDRNNDDKEQMENIINLLLSADEQVPIEAHIDFRKALEKAADRYRAKKIAEFLPFAYNEYLLNLSMNLGTPEKKVKKFKSYAEIRESYYRKIEEGKLINKEQGGLDV